MVPDVTASRFSRYVLRTTDVAAATELYEAVLDRRADGIVQLHESALARGARPHWLGQIQVDHLGGVEAVSARFVERGASRLGPGPGVADFVILRDPGGAIVAVTDSTAEPTAGVAWHQLNTRQAHSAAANYSSIFGWSCNGEDVDLGGYARHRYFAFRAGDPFSGMISDIDGRPEVHPHWLFFFSVPSLDLGVERVQGLGGVVIGPLELPNGLRVAVCEDAQGAVFGLIQSEGAMRLASD